MVASDAAAVAVELQLAGDEDRVGALVHRHRRVDRDHLAKPQRHAPLDEAKGEGGAQLDSLVVVAATLSYLSSRHGNSGLSGAEDGDVNAFELEPGLAPRLRGGEPQ